MDKPTRVVAGLSRMAGRLQRGKVWLRRTHTPSVEVTPRGGFSAGTVALLRRWAKEDA